MVSGKAISIQVTQVSTHDTPVYGSYTSPLTHAGSSTMYKPFPLQDKLPDSENGMKESLTLS